MEHLPFLGQFLDLVLHLDKHLTLLVEQYGPWIYAILFMIIFCETGLVVFPFLPGDSLLFVAGAAAAGGRMDIATLCAVLFAAAVIGDNVNYWIGYVVGPRAFRWERSRLFNKEALIKTHEFYEKHGGKIVIIARFMPLVRTFAPFVAGIARMTYARFFVFDIIGGLVWIGSLTLGGYWFGNQPLIRDHLSAVVFGIVIVSMLPGIIGIIRHRWGGRQG